MYIPFFFLFNKISRVKYINPGLDLFSRRIVTIDKYRLRIEYPNFVYYGKCFLHSRMKYCESYSTVELLYHHYCDGSAGRQIIARDSLMFYWS